MFSPSASAARAPSSTARQLSTGKAPGKPRQTGQVFEFGSSPKRVEHPQKIFDSVFSCACISRPIMVSQLVMVSCYSQWSVNFELSWCFELWYFDLYLGESGL